MPEEALIEAKNEKTNPEPMAGKGSDPQSGFELKNTPETGPTPEMRKDRVEGKYLEILAKVSPAPTPQASADGEAALDARHISATVDEESKIQKLLELASVKGVAHAVRVARSLDDYYALDQMHDALADRLYDGLVARGLIEKD